MQAFVHTPVVYIPKPPFLNRLHCLLVGAYFFAFCRLYRFIHSDSLHLRFLFLNASLLSNCIYFWNAYINLSDFFLSNPRDVSCVDFYNIKKCSPILWELWWFIITHHLCPLTFYSPVHWRHYLACTKYFLFYCVPWIFCGVHRFRSLSLKGNCSMFYLFSIGLSPVQTISLL